MNRQEALVIETARQLIECRRREREGQTDPIGQEARLRALDLAVRALDLAVRETWRGEQPDHD